MSRREGTLMFSDEKIFGADYGLLAEHALSTPQDCNGLLFAGMEHGSLGKMGLFLRG